MAAAQGALSEQDVQDLRETAAAGRPGTVWFTAAAVGVPEGRSAKVVSVADLAEGDFIQVRPAGSRDTVFCSPGELSRIRPARRRAEPVAPPAPDRAPAATRAARSAAPVASAPAPAPPTAVAPAAEPRPAAPARPAPPVASPPAASAPAASSLATSAPVTAQPTAAVPPPAPRARAGKRAEAATAVHLTATPDGEWQAEVFSGSRRVGRAVPVPAADVAVAARALPPAVAEAITAALEGARQRQRERVERLRAELEAAQRALDQLDG
jgi:hypothetical protein